MVSTTRAIGSAATSARSPCDTATAPSALRVTTSVGTLSRSSEGAVACSNGEYAEVAAEPIEAVVDTTGAGDLFAAGFLYGYVNGEPLATCLRRGAIAAAEIISHYGARPEADLQALMAEKLG